MIGDLHLRGYYPVQPDNEGICYSLYFLAEDDFGARVFFTSEGEVLDDMDERDALRARRVKKDLMIDVMTHAVFQRGSRVYIGLRKNDRFNRVSVGFVPSDID